MCRRQEFKLKPSDKLSIVYLLMSDKILNDMKCLSDGQIAEVIWKYNERMSVSQLIVDYIYWFTLAQSFYV